MTLKNVKLLRTAKETTRGRISAHLMNIFMKIVSILNGLISLIFYIENTYNGYHLSGS